MKKSHFFAVGALAVPLMLGLVLSMLLAVPAGAHASLKSSDPAKNAKVEELSEVTLEFSESVRFPVVVVNGPGGERFESGDPVVKGAKVTQAVVPSVPPGKYTIAYRVVSADGHPVEGEIPFTVVAPPSESATPSESASPSESAAPSEEAAPPAAPETDPAATDSVDATAPTGASTADSEASIPGWIWIVVLGIAGVGIGMVLSLRKKP